MRERERARARARVRERERERESDSEREIKSFYTPLFLLCDKTDLRENQIETFSIFYMDDVCAVIRELKQLSPL